MKDLERLLKGDKIGKNRFSSCFETNILKKIWKYNRYSKKNNRVDLHRSKLLFWIYFNFFLKNWIDNKWILDLLFVMHNFWLLNRIIQIPSINLMHLIRLFSMFLQK